MHEGSNREAPALAGHLSVMNLCVTIDKNNKTMTGSTSNECTIDPLKLKFDAFNFNTYELEDGHDENKIMETIKNTSLTEKPVAIICNTIKGKGVSFMENNLDWHYRPPTDRDYNNAIKELTKD